MSDSITADGLFLPPPRRQSSLSGGGPPTPPEMRFMSQSIVPPAASKNLPESALTPSSSPENSSRRSLLRGAGRLFAAASQSAAGTAVSVAAIAALTTRQIAHAGPSSAADADPGALATKLVSRTNFGVTSEEITRFNQLGYSGYLDYHLNHSAIPDTYVQSRLTGGIAGIPALATLTMTGEQLYALANPGQQANELIEATLIRAVYSKRQLYERMVEFWSDHFNLDLNTGSVGTLKTLDDRDTIRANAMTTFGTLLNASIRSPAMLNYLNNDLNTRTGPNENYARELMELHTLSSSGGYTQADVIAVARCLTGWTRYGSTSTPTNLRGTFRYNASVHDTLAKVLSPVFNLSGTTSVTIPANQPNMKDGQDVLDILVRHPRTAEFISTKLCRRFIGENCPAAVIAAVKTTYLNNGAGVVGDVKSMLRTMLAPNIVYTATPRWKRPFHLYVSALRVLPVTITTTSSLRTRLTRAGHLPFNWGPPDGYPDTLEYWSGQQLPRWNFGDEVLPTTATTGSSITGVSTDVGTMLAGATTRADVMNRIDLNLFQNEMDPASKARILTYLNSTTFTQQNRNEAVALSLMTPGFQWY